MANDTGRLTLRVCVSDIVLRGVALSHKGRWPRLEGEGGNINALNPGTMADMGESSAVHGTEVEITPLA